MSANQHDPLAPYDPFNESHRPQGRATRQSLYGSLIHGGANIVVGLLLALLFIGWRLAVKLKREIIRRRCIRELQMLDDRMLRDIGLYRGEIGFVVRSELFERPRHEFAHTSRVEEAAREPEQRLAA
jgi:uncharacterized protein YjiS (DUF1127 family)